MCNICEGWIFFKVIMTSQAFGQDFKSECMSAQAFGVGKVVSLQRFMVVNWYIINFLKIQAANQVRGKSKHVPERLLFEMKCPQTLSLCLYVSFKFFTLDMLFSFQPYFKIILPLVKLPIRKEGKITYK